MLLDTVHGTIERRVLLNYRVEPVVLQRALPRPFRPKLHRGLGIGGVCMIRFSGLRPRFAPRLIGLGSENAAHRIAVEWNQDGTHREGVFIPRRDTGSAFNHWLGGRVFPGIFQRSRFECQETPSSVSVRIVRADGSQEIAFSGHVTGQLPPGSLFATVTEAAAFFSLGATGYSATRKPDHYHGMELRCLDWSIVPLAVEQASSCFFDDTERFPAGTVALDCALLMRGVAHEWHSRPDLYLSPRGDCLTTNRTTAGH